MNNPIEKPILRCENGQSDFPCLNHVNLGSRNRGFTLVELFIVIGIIATLAVIAIPNYLRYKNNARVVVAMTDIRMIDKQIANFAIENGQLPNSLSDLTTIGTINDPWGNPYQYKDTKGGTATQIRKNMSDNPLNHDFDLYSMGADGQSQSQCNAPKSQDDVVRAYEGRYVGLVSDL